MLSSKKYTETKIYLSVPPQEYPKRVIMIGKPFSSQNIKIKSFKQFRSLSRNQQRLRSDVLKKKVTAKGLQIFSSGQKCRLVDGINKGWKGIESKSTQKSQTEVQVVRQKIKVTQYNNRNDQISKKDQEYFQQIRNVKKQKSIKQLQLRLNGVSKKTQETRMEREKDENSQKKYKNLKISIDSIDSGFNYGQQNQIQNSENKSQESCDKESPRSLNLQLESRLKPKLTVSLLPEHFARQTLEKLSTAQKIDNHLDIIERLSVFVDETRQFYDISQEWMQVNFLIYKKYYLERVKVLNFLRKYPMKNPFIIENAQISSKQIIQFIKTKEGNGFREELEIENKIIKQKLYCYYSQFDKDIVGEKINLHETDNFSKWIIEDLWAETILTEYNTDHSKQSINIRLCKILQVIFMISELNGKTVMNFQEAEYAIKTNRCQEYIIQAKTVFQKYLLYKQY